MTSEHLKDNRRHNIVTASQAWAAVYERQKLWREKTFRAEPFAGNEMTEYGNLHEPVALAAFDEEMKFFLFLNVLLLLLFGSAI